MPVPTLDTNNFTSWANSLNAAGWSSFGSDMNSNWHSAWTSRFDLSSRWLDAIDAIASNDRQEWIQGAQKMSAAITAGLSVCAVGMFFDLNPEADVVNFVVSRVEVEYLYERKPEVGITPVGCKIVTIDIILNGVA